MRTSTSIAWSESAFACDANKQKSVTAISRRHRGVGWFLNVVGNLSGLTKIDRVLPIRATVFSVGGGGSPSGDRRLRPHYVGASLLANSIVREQARSHILPSPRRQRRKATQPLIIESGAISNSNVIPRP